MTPPTIATPPIITILTEELRRDLGVKFRSVTIDSGAYFYEVWCDGLIGVIYFRTTCAGYQSILGEITGKPSTSISYSDPNCYKRLVEAIEWKPD